MKHLIFQQAYYGLLLEEALEQIDFSVVPQPFKSILEQMKDKILYSDYSQDLVKINSEFNELKFKLIDEYAAHKQELTPDQQKYINKNLIDLVTKYTESMGGLNTGYKQ